MAHPPSPSTLQLPQPGTPGFAVALVHALNTSSALRGWQVDGTLVAVLLLALMTRRGGVLLDVAAGGGSTSTSTSISMVARVVGALTASVFGLETQVVSLTAHSSAKDISTKAAQGRTATAQALVVTGLEDAAPPVHIRLRSELAAAERARTAPLVIWVRDEARADDPSTPSWLIDLFACSSPVYPDDLAVAPFGLPRQTLIPPEYIMDLRSLLLLTHIHPPLEHHINNVLAALSLHPTLEANISARAAACLTALVKGQRLLATPFDLPPGWRDHLRAWRATRWAEDEYDAGIASALPASTLSATPRDRGTTANGEAGGYGGGPGGVDMWGQRAGEVPAAEAMLGEGATDWYCMPENVAGAWELAVRHRVRTRRPGESILFALNGSAQERVQYARRDGGAKSRQAARRRREEVEDALVQILLDV